MSSSTTATTLTTSNISENSQKLSWLAMPSCRWTDPALSIGQRCESLDPLRRHKYWTVLDKSPAHAVWKMVSKPIHILIQDQYEHLETNGCGIMIDMFMIGKKPTNASPIILFRCETKSSREKAMNLVERKAILAKYPGVRLAQCSKFPKLLALGNEQNWPDCKSISDDEESPNNKEPRNEEALSTLAEGVYVDGPMTSCGLPVIIVRAENTPPRKATIGGFVNVGGIYYGLTTAHAFLPTEELQVEEQDYEFAFYGSDDSGSSDEDSDLPEMTSRGSVSSSSSLRGSAISPDERNNFSPRVISSSSMASDNRDAASPKLERLVNTDLPSCASPTRVGDLHALSIGSGCDWALVRFVEEVWESLTLEIQFNRISYVSGLKTTKFIKTQPENADILIYARSGPIPGKLSAMNSFVITGTYTQEVWTVTLDQGCFRDGDCGSWVVGVENGDLYGHIVSGYPASGTAYLIPACQIFEDIQNQLDETLILPAGLPKRIEEAQMTANENTQRVQVGNQKWQYNFPPINPAEQNPPCNTLWVGNLPIDVSENELKFLFSQQPGYKRMCFRTKQNGPMCFVEFEDVSFATKALYNLYGHPLQKSSQGGIRLSFSKNPLGVRQSSTTSLSQVQSVPHEVDEINPGGLMNDENMSQVLPGTWAARGKAETSISSEAISDHGRSSTFSASADPYEDWTRISDLAERRRIHNQIAQRNYRLRLLDRLEDLKGRQSPALSQPPNVELQPLSPEHPKGLYYTPDDQYVEKYKDGRVEGHAYQEEEATKPHPIPPTTDNLKKAQRRQDGSSRSTKSSGSRDESDYKKSATTRTSRSGTGNNDENVTIKVTGTARIMIGDAPDFCTDGGEIEIRPQRGINQWQDPIAPVRTASSEKRSELFTRLSEVEEKQFSSKKGRNDIFINIKKEEAIVEELVLQRKAIRNHISFKDVDDVNNEISRLQKQIHSGMMNVENKKKALANISFLIEQKSYLRGLDDLQQTIHDKEFYIEELREQFDDHESRALYDKVKEIQAAMRDLGGKQEEIHTTPNMPTYQAWDSNDSQFNERLVGSSNPSRGLVVPRISSTDHDGRPYRDRDTVSRNGDWGLLATNPSAIPSHSFHGREVRKDT